MKQFFLILSGLALLTGCSSKNDSVEGPVQSRIRIAPSISRVTGLNFDTGDRIGLTIVKSGANYCENTPLRFDGTVFVSDDLFWYDDPSEKSNLTAYYPYLAEGAPASFTVRADQKLAADHEASDLLAATATDVVPSQTAVNMVFTHLLTKIVIDITNNSANTIEEVTLKGSRCTATVDLSAKSVQVDASSAETDIYPFPTVTAGRYEAILVPQRAALELEIQTSDGNRHTKTFQATDLQSGAEYAIEAVISNTNKIHASISGAVGSLDFEFECRPLRYENGFISSCGHRWKGIDIRFRRRSIDLNAFRRKIDGRRAAAALQGDFLDRIGGVVRNIDHDFGEQVGEYHIHGRLARYDVRRCRCQQVRGFVIGGELLVGTNGEARRSSFR
jgi:hypothetical protein